MKIRPHLSGFVIEAESELEQTLMNKWSKMHGRVEIHSYGCMMTVPWCDRHIDTMKLAVNFTEVEP